MNIGICKVRFHLPEKHSLKDKRRVVKSITSRVRSKYNVSIAEVDDQDLWQVLTLGISYVSNHSDHAHEVLSKVVDFIRSTKPEAEMIDYEIEIIPAL